MYLVQCLYNNGEEYECEYEINSVIGICTTLAKAKEIVGKHYISTKKWKEEWKGNISKVSKLKYSPTIINKWEWAFEATNQYRETYKLSIEEVEVDKLLDL